MNLPKKFKEEPLLLLVNLNLFPLSVIKLISLQKI